MKVNASNDKIFAKVGKIVKIIDDLKECGCLGNEYKLPLPKICLVGATGSGKSTLINAFIGWDLIPKGNETKSPIELKMVHANYVSPKIEIINENSKKEFFLNVNEIKEIQNFMNSSLVKINFHSNACADITLVDLPPFNDKNKNKIYEHIKDENCVILVVSSVCDENLQEESEKILKFIKEADISLSRTVQIYTKTDMLTSHDVLHKIKKQIEENDNSSRTKLKNGYVFIKNPTSDLTEHTLIEREYFKSHSFFKYSSLNTTLETLTEKIKKIIFDNEKIKNEILETYTVLKASTETCQKEIIKFGTDYIAYTNDSKHTYIASLVNIFSDTLEKIFSSKMNDTNENIINHRLKEKYFEFLKEYLIDYLPSQNVKNEEIIRIIKLTEGDRLSGFPESEVIYTLLEGEIEKLREEVSNYLEEVSELVSTVLKNNINRLFCRFPRLLEKIEELMNIFIEENFSKMKYIIESVSEMNFNYLYMDEKSISYSQLIDKFVIPHQQPPEHRKSHEFTSAKDLDSYYNGVAEYVKILINHFYAIMVRNLRESVPKATGKYLLNSIKYDTRFYLLSNLNVDYATYENLLEEDSEVMKKRTYFLNLMKVLKESEKGLLYDEEVRNCIKGEKRTIDHILEKNMKMNTIYHDGNLNRKRESEAEINVNSTREKEINTNSTREKEIHINKTEKKNSIPSVNPHKETTQTTTNTHKTITTTTSTTNKPQSTSQNISQTTTQTSTQANSTGNISIKLAPSGDIKDAKVNLDMDVDTAFNLYQANKKYLPTTQQVITGAKATATFVEKTNDKLNEESNQDSVVTGNKGPKTKSDPLTKLFGIKSTETTTKPTAPPTTSSKKGFF